MSADAGVGIDQLQTGSRLAVLFRVELQSQAGQHAQKRAVHELAVGEVEDEAGVALLPERGDERLEIDAALEARPAGDADADERVVHPDLQVGWPIAHTNVFARRLWDSTSGESRRGRPGGGPGRIRILHGRPGRLGAKVGKRA